MKKSMWVFLSLALIASPALADNGTFEINDFWGSSFKPNSSIMLQVFDQSAPLEATFDFGDTLMAGSIPMRSVSAQLQFQFSRGTNSWDIWSAGSGLFARDASGDAVISGRFTDVDYVFSDGQVTITAILMGIDGESLFVKNTFEGQGWAFSIPDHTRYFDAVVEISYPTNATSWDDLFSFSGMIGGQYGVSSMRIIFEHSPIPEPTTMLLVLAGAGWLARRRR